MQLQPKTYVVEEGSEHLYIAMMDSLRQQTKDEISSPRQKKISDSHRQGYTCPMCENVLSQMM